MTDLELRRCPIWSSGGGGGCGVSCMYGSVADEILFASSREAVSSLIAVTASRPTSISGGEEGREAVIQRCVAVSSEMFELF